LSAAIACTSTPFTAGTAAHSGTVDGSVEAASDAPEHEGATPEADAAEAGSDATRPNLPTETLVAPASTPLLTIQGERGSTLGIYDPSLVYPRGASGGVMSYSTVAANS